MRRFDFDNRNFAYKRGQIINIELDGKGSEQKGKRPCIVVQNDMGNKFSPTLIVVPVTSQTGKRFLPTHVKLDSEKYYLEKDSTILAEQIKVADKTRCVHYMGQLDEGDLARMDKALAISIGL